MTEDKKKKRGRPKGSKKKETFNVGGGIVETDKNLVGWHQIAKDYAKYEVNTPDYDGWDIPYEKEVVVSALTEQEIDLAVAMKKKFDEGYPKAVIWSEYNRGQFDKTFHRGTKDFGKAWAVMVKLMKMEIESDENERAAVYNRYMKLYKRAFDTGQLKEARLCLDSVVRLLNLSKQAGGNIIIDKDKNISISFGIPEIDNAINERLEE